MTNRNLSINRPGATHENAPPRPTERFYSRPASTSTFADHGIKIPLGTRGEARTICPKCTPNHRNKRSKTLSANADRGIWHCFRCGWSGSLTGGKHHASNPLPDIAIQSPLAQGKRLSKMRSLWKMAIPLNHADAEPARTYLISRGLGEILNDPPTDLRLHPTLPYWDQDDSGQWHKLGEFPALVALVRGLDGAVASVHRTYLQPDGRGKADVPNPKKLMTPIIEGGLDGAAIQLYRAGERLAVAEGIETALAVRIATGLPVWSTIFAAGMARLEIPEQVREILICADNDESETGKIAAYTLTSRLLRQGVEAKVILPAVAGTDWLDVLNTEEDSHG